jgi:hypothetical protein
MIMFGRQRPDLSGLARDRSALSFDEDRSISALSISARSDVDDWTFVRRRTRSLGYGCPRLR